MLRRVVWIGIAIADEKARMPATNTIARHGSPSPNEIPAMKMPARNRTIETMYTAAPSVVGSRLSPRGYPGIRFHAAPALAACAMSADTRIGRWSLSPWGSVRMRWMSKPTDVAKS